MQKLKHAQGLKASGLPRTLIARRCFSSTLWGDAQGRGPWLELRTFRFRELDMCGLLAAVTDRLGWRAMARPQRCRTSLIPPYADADLSSIPWIPLGHDPKELLMSPANVRTRTYA